MTKKQIQDLIQLIVPHFPIVSQAIADRLDPAFEGRQDLGVFSFSVRTSQMTPQVFDLLRPTNWFIVSLPDSYFGDDTSMATIREKVFVEPTPSICFHATPITNWESIRANGLLPGILVGKSGRGKMFADSPFYIYASLTESDARDWCESFDEKDFLIYPVRIGEAGIRLYADPCGTTQSIIVGYILDSNNIPFRFLDPPVQVKKE